MNATGVEDRPTDRLLAWLSARGDASRPTVDRAARAIADRFDLETRADRSPVHRLVAPLRRLGHAEEVKGGYSVAPTTLCWMPRLGRGTILGARDRPLLDDLGRRFGPSFQVTYHDSDWPATWSVSGDREAISAAMAELRVEFVDEPGMRLLSSLPTLEAAIASLPDAGHPPALSWTVADPVRWRWVPCSDRHVVDGLVRSVARRPSLWRIERAGIWRSLDSAEARAVAWWAELVRLARLRLVHHLGTGRLILPASPLPPPLMIERPLIWASGTPPRRESRRNWMYEEIDTGRAVEVARILGIPLEIAP